MKEFQYSIIHLGFGVYLLIISGPSIDINNSTIIDSYINEVINLDNYVFETEINTTDTFKTVMYSFSHN